MGDAPSCNIERSYTPNIPTSRVVTNPAANSGSFSAAFASAHNRLGAGQTFMWNGQSYSTNRGDGRDLRSERIARSASVPIRVTAIPEAKVNTPVFSAATRGIRNHNPGNLDFTAIKWNGKLPRDPKIESRFERFDTPHNGIRAMARNLQTYINGGTNTTEKIINKWAPSHENNTSAYVKAVAQSVSAGDVNKVLKADHKTLTALTKAIIKHENGQNPYSEAQISAAVADAMTK